MGVRQEPNCAHVILGGMAPTKRAEGKNNAFPVEHGGLTWELGKFDQDLAKEIHTAGSPIHFVVDNIGGINFPSFDLRWKKERTVEQGKEKHFQRCR